MTGLPVHRALILALVPVVALAARPASAQEDEPEPIIYASYLQCEPSSHARVGEIIRDTWAPIAQRHIDAGHLAAWGSLSHNTGGSWSRAVYHVGMDRAQLFEMLDVMLGEWMEEAPEASAEFWDACDEHEDYVWTHVASSAPAAEVVQDRPAAGMSVYWNCWQGKEAVADLIMEEVSAEAWNAQVEAGLINSWGWYSHFLGDKYRRLLVADGASHEDLMTARDNVIQWGAENAAALAGAFTDVCFSHVDYLWDIELSYP